MIQDRDHLLERLREVGLSRYEASVYLGLLTDQDAKVSEISKRTGVPQPKVYQALEALVEKGFCSLGPDQVNRYRPIAPRLALDPHLRDLDRRRQSTLVLADELGERLERGRGQALWAPPVEIVKGLGQVATYVIEHLGAARTSLDCFAKEPQVWVPELTGTLLDRTRADVRVRVLVEQSYLDSLEVSDEVFQAFTGGGGVVRHIESLPSKLVLVDGELALISLPRADAETFLMLAFRHPGLVGHFRTSFEACWERGEPLEREEIVK